MEECCPAVDVKVRDARGDFLHSLDSLAFSFYNEHDSKVSTPRPFLQNKQIESNPMLSAVSGERLAAANCMFILAVSAELQLMIIVSRFS